MNILDIFRTQPKPAATPAADPSAVNPLVPGKSTPGNKDGIGPAAFPKPGEGEKSPMENYLKLWETDPNSKAPPTLVPEFKTDPAKLMEAAKNIDFTKVLPADVLAKVKTGDGEAIAIAINLAAQAGFANSAQATAGIVQAALTQQAKKFKEEVMPEILREHTSSQLLKADNPIFDNPAVRPMVDMVEAQMRGKYPNASAAEIKDHSAAYFTGFVAELAKGSGMSLTKVAAVGDTATPGSKKTEDWGKFFGVEESATK